MATPRANKYTINWRILLKESVYITTQGRKRLADILGAHIATPKPTEKISDF